MKYEFLEHTADVKYRAYGKTLSSCFSNSAIAMFKAMYSEKIENKIKKKIKVSGKDLERLLYNFLEELLILLDSENFFVSKIKVQVDKKKLELTADVFGDDASKYEIGLQVKAVTYNEMFVKKLKGEYVSQVVLDV